MTEFEEYVKTKGKVPVPTEDQQFHREASYLRPMFALNDWWGAGFIRGVAGIDVRREYVRWYCGRGPALNQYQQGFRDGLRVAKEANEVSDD